jgi:hypothetical protein
VVGSGSGGSDGSGSGMVAIKSGSDSDDLVVYTRGELGTRQATQGGPSFSLMLENAVRRRSWPRLAFDFFLDGLGLFRQSFLFVGCRKKVTGKMEDSVSLQSKQADRTN